MRFVDGPTTSAERVIAASPTVVWRYVTDITIPPAESDELYRAEWAEPFSGPALGARLHGWNRRRDTEWDTYSTVTRYDAPDEDGIGCFEWTVDPMAEGGEPIATWGFDLESAPDPVSGVPGGATRVVQRVRLGPGESGLTMAIAGRPDAEERIIEGRLAQQRAAMEANLDAIAAAAVKDNAPDAGVQADVVETDG